MSDFTKEKGCELVPAVNILSDPSGARKIETENGEFLCSCDGKSKAIRACMAGLVALDTHTSKDGRKDPSNHERVVKTCVTQGNNRIEHRCDNTRE